MKFSDIAQKECKRHWHIAREVLEPDDYKRAEEESRSTFEKTVNETPESPAKANICRRAANQPITEAIYAATGKSSFQIEKEEKERIKNNRREPKNYKQYATGSAAQKKAIKDGVGYKGSGNRPKSMRIELG